MASSTNADRDVRLLCSIQLQNILSFGPDTPALELRSLNVLIGANGSGKSNLLDCVGLLQSAPESLADYIRAEGGIREWLWKGAESPTARVEAVVAGRAHWPEGPRYSVRHRLDLREASLRFDIVSEYLGLSEAHAQGAEEELLYKSLWNQGQLAYLEEDVDVDEDGPFLSYKRSYQEIKHGELDPESSILAQRRDPSLYPELSHLGDQYRLIRTYRDWAFGRKNPARDWQDTGGRKAFLTPAADNLALILNGLRTKPAIKNRIKALLNELYGGITSFDTDVYGTKIQAYLEETNFNIPASRLSDGTLRFLSLLAVLLHPEPPPLICLEEPELGLHPDVVVAVGKLIKEASERTQLIVTTHSDIIIDCVAPEDVVVFDKHDGQTEMKRLDGEKLSSWLETYALSELWTRGKLGGTRW